MAKTKTLNDIIDEISLEDLGAVNDVDVFSDVKKLAGHYGRASELCLRAINQHAVAKTRLEQLEGQIDLSVRKALEVSGEKVTEAKIKSAIKSAQPWVVQKTITDEADSRVERCKAALKTLDKKERMLDLLARFQIREYTVAKHTAA